MLTRSMKSRPEKGEELGNGGNGARRAAAGIEEDELDGGDSELLFTIPGTSTTRATRWIFCSASICSARLLAAAKCE